MIPWEVLAFGVLPELAEVIPTPIDIVLTNSLDTAPLGKTIAGELGVPWVATFHEQAPPSAPLGRGVLRARVRDAPAARLSARGLQEMYAARGREWGDAAKVVLSWLGAVTVICSRPRCAATLRERHSPHRTSS